eukprot:Protomagalhaensia_sp_Gyna_25__3439@NODE_30_length_7280_cov_84_840492_g20_i0_p5_GENE_NODE_30_length_7280_cov_84_840492_g20_i0NODE_30_length_7280_cov_84_840492_g20_i0_p5_ORF_typecomplete_len259_score43_51_NODE_30_length_7280_cov_84_840492_g20_i035954371
MRIPMKFLPLVILVAQARNEVSMPMPLVQQPVRTIASRGRIPVPNKVEDGAPVQQVAPFAPEHVGQGFLRKALDVLDARWADRLRLNAHLPSNRGAAEVVQGEVASEGVIGMEVEEEEEEVQNPPIIRARQQPPRPIDDIPEVEEAQPEFEREIEKDAVADQFEANRLIPVELDVNEGVDDAEPLETEGLESAEQISPGGGNFRMIGSATAGVGVIGSVGYCMLSRRRHSKRLRAELPMYDMPASADKGRRRGLAKYR